MLTIFKREDGKSPYYYIRGTVRFGRKRITVKESTGCLKKADAENDLQRMPGKNVQQLQSLPTIKQNVLV